MLVYKVTLKQALNQHYNMDKVISKQALNEHYKMSEGR